MMIGYVRCKYFYHKHKGNSRGLAERVVKRKLEKEGWLVWRSDCLNVLDLDLYPNVRKKYERLFRVLKRFNVDYEFLQYVCYVHHGLPDFICYRLGKIKFVECKYKYEPLNENQKKCIPMLQSKGFWIEIYRIVNHSKIRRAIIHVNGGKRVLERQTALKEFVKVL